MHINRVKIIKAQESSLKAFKKSKTSELLRALHPGPPPGCYPWTPTRALSMDPTHNGSRTLHGSLRQHQLSFFLSFFFFSPHRHSFKNDRQLQNPSQGPAFSVELGISPQHSSLSFLIIFQELKKKHKTSLKDG